jgi:AcrR family transcriptional regulator
VNLATVYYHFGSKEGLMEAVLRRRFGPLREEQLRLLDEAQGKAEGKPLRVETILEVLLGPPLRLAVNDLGERHVIARLIGRVATEPNLQTQKVLRNQHQEVSARFLDALHHAVPGLPVSELQTRLDFLWGALAFTLCNPERLQVPGTTSPLDGSALLPQMIQFFAPGFRATPGSCEKPSARAKARGPCPN